MRENGKLKQISALSLVSPSSIILFSSRSTISIPSFLDSSFLIEMRPNTSKQVKRTSTDDNDLQPENNISQNSIPDPKRNRLEQVARDTDESNEEVPNNHDEVLPPAVPHLDVFRQPSEPNILAFFGRSQSIEESLEKMNRGPKAKVINDR